MSAAERLAEAHHNANLLYFGHCGDPSESWADHLAGHLPCFTEDQNEDTATLAQDLDTGRALREAVAALPEGASLKMRFQPWNGYTVLRASPIERPHPPFEIAASAEGVMPVSRNESLAYIAEAADALIAKIGAGEKR
jgi:hypothetical protein